MKHIIIVMVLLVLTGFTGKAVTTGEQAQKIKELENMILVLQEKQKLFDTAIQINQKNYETELKSKVNEIQQANTAFAITMKIAGPLALIALIATLWQIFIGFDKKLNEKKEELARELERKKVELTAEFDLKKKELTEEMENKKAELNNDYQKKINQIKQSNKDALNSLVNKSSIELDLVSYPIVILVNEEDDDTKNLERILIAFHFKYVQVQTFARFTPPKDNRTVLIYLENNFSQTELPGFVSNHHDFGHLYVGKEKFAFPEEAKCTGFTSSLSKLYENLMSLLHYKRFLNKQH